MLRYAPSPMTKSSKLSPKRKTSRCMMAMGFSCSLNHLVRNYGVSAVRGPRSSSRTNLSLSSSCERASVVGFSLIILPDQEKWSSDGAGIKAITGGDTVAIDPKYRNAYSTYMTAVILAVNNNLMRLSDRSGGVSRRRVILTFPDAIPANERDPQLLDKSARNWPL